MKKKSTKMTLWYSEFSRSVVTLILCLLSAVTGLVEQGVLHVLPHNVSQEACPVENCFTLKEVIENDNIFVSNTKIVLFPVLHILNEKFDVTFISTVSNISLACESVGQQTLCHIQCMGNAGFFFHNVANVSISGIFFENCGASVSRYFQPWDQLHGTSVVLLFRYSTNIVHTGVTIVGGMDYGIAMIGPQENVVLINTTLKVHSQGVCFYAAMDNDNRQATLRPLTVKLVMNNVSFIEGNYGNNDGAHCAAILMRMEYYVKIRMTDIYIESCQVDILYYDICKTDASLQHITVISGFYRLNPDIIHSAQMSSCDHEMTEWKRFNVNDANFTNTIIQIMSATINKFGLSFQIGFSNTVIKRCSMAFMDIYEIIMSNVSFLENYDIVFTSVMIRIKGSFRFERNFNGITIMSDLLKWNRGSKIIITENTRAVFKNNILSNNSGSSSVIHVTSSTFDIFNNTYVLFEGNFGMQCGGILLENSTMNFHPGKSLVLLLNNEGNKGGAMAFYATSQIVLICSNTEINFINNHAQRVGGAIYVHDFGSLHLVSNAIGYNYRPMLVEGLIDNVCSQSQVNMTFINNTAQLAGSALYGGWIDSTMYYYNYDFLQNIDQKPFFQLNNSGDDLSVVSSDPVRVCLCLEHTPNCNGIAQNVELFPGQTFVIRAVAVGQRYGTAPATVQALFRNSLESHLEDTQYIQGVGIACTNLTFTLRSSAKTETILLMINNRDMSINTLEDAVWIDETSQYNKLFKQFTIHVHLKSCPLGFRFDSLSKECDCLEALTWHRIQCDFSTYTILRPIPKWITATATYNNLSDRIAEVIVHNHCPFDYCKVSDSPMRLDLEDPDEQCAFNRSGILCGACKQNFSNVLGTSKCRECRRPWIALIIPLMAVAGIFLVINLIFLNLTVSVGTINGFIFYANIVRANHATFFKGDSFLSYFIAWLNLDLGIETCFYQGLDAIAKTWLQFLFPLYVWVMVIAIIAASHYSTIASKLSGNNAVQVLATLFLLSYSKLLRIVIMIFSTTELVYPDNSKHWVWLYDGNVDYLKGQHVPLFLAGLFILIVLTIPYTAMLFSIQWLLRCSSYKVFFWVQKLHPLFDAYTGPYKIKHRYWTGLLLLIRACLILTFSVNTLGDPTINLLAIFVVAFCLLAYLSMIGGIYKQWWLNLIEISFITNLGILSGAVGLYQNVTTGPVSKITQTSVIIAIIIFVTIVLYHLVMAILKIRVLKEYMARCILWNRKVGEDQGDQEMEQPDPVVPTITQSVVALNSLSGQKEIEEPLLSSRDPMEV